MIELRNICKFYEDKKILEEINVSFKKGKITSLIGSNGAGKSTLLSIASRLLKPSSGELLCDGRAYESFKAKN